MTNLVNKVPARDLLGPATSCRAAAGPFCDAFWRAAKSSHINVPTTLPTYIAHSLETSWRLPDLAPCPDADVAGGPTGADVAPSATQLTTSPTN